MAYSASNPGASQGFLIDPPAFSFAITPTDDTQFAHATRAIWVGVGGDVKVCGVGVATAQVLKNVPAGWLVVQAQGVDATGTTATNLVGWY